MSIGESLHTKSMGGGIRMIDKGIDGTTAVHYCQREPGSDRVWKTGCSTVMVHIAFLREWVARLYYRLSEIVDSKFVKPSTAGRFEFTPILVAHALGAAWLDYARLPRRQFSARPRYC
jgi:hypothetical protein